MRRSVPSDDPIARKWRDMPRYGGRCRAWDDPGTFRAWALANGWRPGLEVSRRNPRVGWGPGNCLVAPAGTSIRAAYGRRRTFHLIENRA